MGHGAEALDVHEIFDMHRAGLRNPSDVVARKIDQHQMFCAFLGASSQLTFTLLLLGGSASRGARPGDGMRLELLSIHFEEHLGRGTQEHAVAVPSPRGEEVLIGRWAELRENLKKL